jgi:hypothetical protein
VIINRNYLRREVRPLEGCSASVKVIKTFFSRAARPAFLMETAKIFEDFFFSRRKRGGQASEKNFPQNPFPRNSQEEFCLPFPCQQLFVGRRRKKAGRTPGI